jgi:hypothetical protein
VPSLHLARLGGNARPAGSAALADARRYCAASLESIGFAVSEQAFEYSQFPGAWGAPVAGVFVAALATALITWRRTSAAWILVAVAAAVTIPVLLYVARAGVLDLPVMRRTGVNLHATRGAEPPIVWLVAHLDSKWQPVSMIVRVAGVIVTSIAVVAALVVGLGPIAVPDRAAMTLVVLVWIGAMPLILSVVGDRNHGTLDNASGVAAVLEAAALVPRDARVGVLITDAEEMALAGARAWARSHAAGVALNCDSVDDDGRLTVMYSTPRPRRLITLVEQVTSGDANGERLRVLHLIPGILTDSVALAGAGWETLTLSRGNVRTLQRIHTSRDSLDAMRGTGIALTARILARTATEIA